MPHTSIGAEEKMFSVIFDMDGTLLDTQKICIPAWEYGGRNQNIVGMGEYIQAVCGMNRAGWTKYITDRHPDLDTERFNREVASYISENLHVRFKRGGRELLDHLKANGVKIAIASGSSRSTISHHLGEVGAADDFDAIVGGMDVERGKPEPDIFLLAAEKLGVDPRDCFVFEDSANGVRAGYRAGMRVIGIKDIAEFPEDAKRLMWRELADMSEAIPIFDEIIKNEKDE